MILFAQKTDKGRIETPTPHPPQSSLAQARRVENPVKHKLAQNPPGAQNPTHQNINNNFIPIPVS